MRRLLLLFLTCLLLGWNPGMAQQRKMADVQHLADSILNHRQTGWGHKVKIQNVRTKRVICASDLLSSTQDAFYVCDAGEDGFAIISADERMTPVLGFSHSDVFDPEDIPGGMRELLESYAQEYEAMMSCTPHRSAKRHIEGVQEQLGPLFATQWGQDEPYNNRCPWVEDGRCITGCIAVSTAQILNYYHFPHSGTGWVDYETKTHKIRIQEDLSSFVFSWPYILDYYWNGAPEESVNAISDLLYACAIAVKMDFGLKASSASSDNQLLALVENFGYDPDISYIQKNFMTTNEWQTIMLNELNDSLPIAYSAASPTLGGHSFIIDGYKADEDAYPFYHVNWGWKGYLDGYFKLSGLEADDYDFVKNHSAVINIKPDNGIRDAENIWQAEQVELSSARINPNLTHTVTVTLRNACNCSYKAFTGKMMFYLQAENGTETLLGTYETPSVVPFYSFYPSFVINGTLPPSFEEGDYTVVLYSQADGSDVKEKITYPSPITLTVTTITESYTPYMSVNELINVGEDWNGLSMAVRATYPRNTADKPFTGWIQMAVADEEGNILDHFGRVYYIANLGKGYYQNVGVTFDGQLPEYLEDGAYRLYLAANQSGYLEWGKVTQFKLEGGQLEEGIETFIPFWLEDGRIIYHKQGEEELPIFYADLQVTEMPLVSFNATTRYVETQINDLANFGSERFIGQLSMCLYDENNTFITTFGDVHRQSTPIEHYQIQKKTMTFTGNLPEETEDGHYCVCIAAKQSGCQGWSPLKGCSIVGNKILDRDNDLHYEFIVLNGKMYKLETDDDDGLMTPVGNTKQELIYDLNGRQVQKMTKSGIYIIGGKKVVK